MSTVELVEQLKRMSDAERLEVIEAATRLVRRNLATMPGSANEQDRRLRTAAEGIRDLYEPGGELTEWTALDAEEFSDDYFAG